MSASFVMDTTTGTRHGHGHSGRRLVGSTRRGGGQPIRARLIPIRHTTRQGLFPKKSRSMVCVPPTLTPRRRRTCASQPSAREYPAQIPRSDGPVSLSPDASPREREKRLLPNYPGGQGLLSQKRPSRPDRASGPSGPRIGRLPPRPRCFSGAINAPRPPSAPKPRSLCRASCLVSSSSTSERARVPRTGGAMLVYQDLLSGACEFHPIQFSYPFVFVFAWFPIAGSGGLVVSCDV